MIISLEGLLWNSASLRIRECVGALGRHWEFSHSSASRTREAVEKSEEEHGTRIPSLCSSGFSPSQGSFAVPPPGVVVRTEQVRACGELPADPMPGCCDGGALTWPSLPGLWFCFLFFRFLKEVWPSGSVLEIGSYAQEKLLSLLVVLLSQHNSENIYWAVTLLQSYNQGQRRPCAQSFHPALCFDLLIFKKKFACFFKYSIIIWPSRKAEKNTYHLEMRNRISFFDM